MVNMRGMDHTMWNIHDEVEKLQLGSGSIRARVIVRVHIILSFVILVKLVRVRVRARFGV